MAPRIQVPPDILRMTCPESRQRRFTTKENEKKIGEQGLNFEIAEDKTN